jgi:type 1 glutamine amidotransferase
VSYHRALLIFAEERPDPYHTTVTPQVLADHLATSDLDVTVARTAAGVSAEALAAADLLVLWMLVGEGCQAAFERLRAQVQAGTPLLSVHTALWCATPGGQAMAFGGPYRGHPPYQRFRVTIDQPEHPIVAGVTDFDITDEPYQIDHGPDVTVLAHTDGTRIATTWHDQDRHDPWMVECDTWTRSHTFLPLVYLKPLGRGWVVGQALGHDATALAQPAVRGITAQAVAWLLDRREREHGRES